MIGSEGLYIEEGYTTFNRESVRWVYETLTIMLMTIPYHYGMCVDPSTRITCSNAGTNTFFLGGGLGSSIRSTWTDDQQIIATNTNQTDPPAINCIRLPNPKSQFWLQMFSLIKSNVGRGFIEFLAYMLANL